MSRDTAWVEEARKAFAAGMSVPELAAAFRRSEYMIRRTLNINGLAERIARDNVEKRTGPMNKYVVSSRRSRAGQSAKTYIDPPAPRGVSLPTLSFLAKPVDEPSAPIRRLAPKTRCRVEPARVATIREIHRRLIRSGRIAEPSLVQELRS
jgi:hypothetical protein